MISSTELRQRIIDTVLNNGGHLASSLGAVEIALALRRVFNPEVDRIIWDVGHQSYAWKLLTERTREFSTLRQFGGLAGFPNPNESKADPTFAGHAGAAISTALGFAAARDAKGSSEQVVAVVGDASIANGMSFEALNNCATSTKKLIIVLNDNEMSISRPVGAFSSMLGRMLGSRAYNIVKTAAESVGHAFGFTFMRNVYHKVESRIKGLFVASWIFEQFGLRYIGPIDGHDLSALVSAFEVAKRDKHSVIVHVSTQKGHGYEPAVQDPVTYHGISGLKAKVSSKPSWSTVFGEAISAAARRDNRVVAITAAMKDGTGLTEFSLEFPHRFFDVGISEEHAVGFAAGLAANGLRPVVAIYSTFMQRAVDQVMHDVCLANLPVVFCVDRAGVVGSDGVTHQGVFDVAMLRCLPNLTICQPRDAGDFHQLLTEALNRNGPTVIRYPRGTVNYADRAMAVAEKLGCEWAHARYLKPLDMQFLNDRRAAGKTIVTLENNSLLGGWGESIPGAIRFAWPDRFISHGSVDELERECKLDVESIVDQLRQYKLNQGNEEYLIYG